MKDTLKPGMTFEFKYKVPDNKTVPHLYPEFDEGKIMPNVFATGYLVGLFEFACIKFLSSHIDWPDEQTVGIHVNINHTAATPPGFTVTVKGTLEKAEGKKLTFHLEANDGKDKISEGTHERFVIDAGKFNAAIAKKAQNA